MKRIQIQAMVDAAVEKYGQIDILVSCAGVIQIKQCWTLLRPIGIVVRLLLQGTTFSLANW